MKKGLLLIIGLLALFLVYAYVFHSPSVIISRVVKIPCPAPAAARLMQHPEKWPEWWTRSETAGDSVKLLSNQVVISPGKNLVNGKEMRIADFKGTVISGITAFPLTTDSCLLEWKTELRDGNGPMDRIRTSRFANRVKEATDSLLAAFAGFGSVQRNIYGMDVRQEKVTDTLLIVTRFETRQKPGTEEIYGAIDRLAGYASSHKAQLVHPPMLNIKKTDSLYRVMVALPLDKQLPGKGDIQFKQMISGNIMVGEVTGGWNRVAEAFEQLGHYVSDHRKTSPALPFESLVTDRRKETDSSRWITRIYYPVY